MASTPYIDSLWATKKRQVPFLVGPITIIWETSYGMTIRNPGQMESDRLREMVDAAIERAFEDDIRNITNNKGVRDLIMRAGLYVEEPDFTDEIEIEVKTEGVDNTPVVESVTTNGEKEKVHMSVDELLAKGFLTKGVKQTGGES